MNMEGAAAAAAAPIFKKRGAKSSTIRKRPATPPPEDSDASSGYTSTDEDEGGHSIKRRRKTAIVTASSNNQKNGDTSSSSSNNANANANGGTTKDNLSTTTTQYTGDRSTRITATNDATKHSNWFDDAPPPLTAQSTTNDPPNPNPTNTTKTSKPTHGPTKSHSSNVRTITITDFAPDVCKDYKQTGFCGFGDSCKFLHAREDYKQGWQLDKEWEKVARPGRPGGTTTTTSSTSAPTTTNPSTSTSTSTDNETTALLAQIPFACIICKSSYKSPIVTKCGHYFCESCALQRYRKSPSCAACGAGTNGVFNTAKGLKKLLEKKKEREDAAKLEAEESNGGDDGVKGA